MIDNNKLYKLIKKIRNNELLNEEDLINFAFILLNELNLDINVESYLEPAYDIKTKAVYINSDIHADWMQYEIARFMDGMLIKPHLEYKKKIRKTTINDYNIVMLNAVAHEVRHAYQPEMLKNKEIYMKEDITLLKNMLKAIKKISVLKNFIFHDYLYYEYDADLNAAIKIAQLNEEYFNLNLDYYNEFAAYKILRAYTSLNAKRKAYPIFNNNSINGFKFKNKNIEYMDAFNYLKELDNSPETIFNGGMVDEKMLLNLRDIYMGDTKIEDIRKVLK